VRRGVQKELRGSAPRKNPRGSVPLETEGEKAGKKRKPSRLPAGKQPTVERKLGKEGNKANNRITDRRSDKITSDTKGQKTRKERDFR